MAAGPAQAPTAGAWLRDTARLAGRSQRLLVFPLGLAILVLAAAVPAAIAAGADSSFSALARYVVSIDDRMLDGLDGTADVGTVEWILLGSEIVTTALAAAWLTGAFVRSLVEHRVVPFPGLRAFASLAVVYAASGALLIPIGAVARAGDGWEFAALLAFVLLAIPTLVADYAIVIDDLSVPRALVMSVRVVRTRPALSLLAFVLAYTLGTLVIVLFDDTIRDADEVFPPFLVAAALAHGLQIYATNCGLIALYLGVREPPGGDADANGRVV